MTGDGRVIVWAKEVADRFGLDIDKIHHIDSLADLGEGYSLLICAHKHDGSKEYAHLSVLKDTAYSYLNRRSLAEGRRLDVYDFLILRLFIDKYRNGAHELPVLGDKSRWAEPQSTEAIIRENRVAMEIMLRPLETYDDLLQRFDEVKRAPELGWDIRDYETFDGTQSREKTLNGGRPDREDTEFRVYRPVGDETWDIYTAVERDNERLRFEMRIHGRRYLHEYILNTHLRVI